MCSIPLATLVCHYSGAWLEKHIKLKLQESKKQLEAKLYEITRNS